MNKDKLISDFKDEIKKINELADLLKKEGVSVKLFSNCHNSLIEHTSFQLVEEIIIP